MTATRPGSPTTTAPASAPAPAGPRRLVLVVALAAAVLTLGVAAATILGGPGRQVETGVVVAVQATSLSSVQGFSIRTADGRTVDFRVGTIENATTFAPGHLAEHKVTLAPIRVTYIDVDGAHTAVRLDDAP